MSHDHAAAKQFRDVVASIARAEIEKMFPPDRYAQVHEIHEDQRRVIVQYNGEGPDNLVSVPYNSVKPAYVGQWVRIGGSPGDRHVIDTLGGTAAEERTEEVLSQAPLYPKWMQTDLRMVETAPIAVWPESIDTVSLANGAIGGTVIRVPTTMVVESIVYYIQEGQSGSVKGVVYRMGSQFDAELVAETAPIAASSAVERNLALQSQVTLNRGEEVLVGIHNFSGGSITMTGWTHRGVRTLERGQDALTYQCNGLGSNTPSQIFNAQWSNRYVDRVWYFGLVGTP